MRSLNWSLVFVGIVMGAICLIITAVAPEGWNHRNETPNFIDVVSLAEKIKNRETIKVVDLRSKKQFEEFHLPTAINIPLDNFDGFDTFDKTPVVFYSGDDWLVRQLWNKLNQQQRNNSLVLYGGAHDWYDYLLYPKLPIEPQPEDSILAERLWILNNFYGGTIDFVDDSNAMDYYHFKWSSATWPKPKARKGLVRKGC